VQKQSQIKTGLLPFFLLLCEKSNLAQSLVEVMPRSKAIESACESAAKAQVLYLATRWAEKLLRF